MGAAVKYTTKEELEIGYPIYARYTVVLGLRGTELHVYALVRSFGDKGYFGSYRYAADMLGVSYSSVSRAFATLISQEYIIKEVDVGRYRDTEVFKANLELEELMVEDFLATRRQKIKIESSARVEAARARVRAAMGSNDGSSTKDDSSPKPGEQYGIRDGRLIEVKADPSIVTYAEAHKRDDNTSRGKAEAEHATTLGVTEPDYPSEPNCPNESSEAVLRTERISEYAERYMWDDFCGYDKGSIAQKPKERPPQRGDPEYIPYDELDEMMHRHAMAERRSNR